MRGNKILKFKPAQASHRYSEICRRIKTLEDQMILVLAQARLNEKRRRLSARQ